MPGLAKTDNFMLGTATVMIGPVADLYDLNPTEHSIGLVKNFAATSEPSYTELTQGVKNNIVHSVLTSNPVRCSMEVYEYTASNLLYALGLDGSDAEVTATTAVNGAVDGGSPTANDFVVDSDSGLAIDDYIMIINDAEDDFIVRKITNLVSTTVTVDRELPDIIDGAVVKKVNRIDVGSKEDQPFFAAKVAGKLANGEQVVLLIPKIRITAGFNLSFTVSDYANLPIEFTVYDPVSTDPFYADFRTSNAALFKS